MIFLFHKNKLFQNKSNTWINKYKKIKKIVDMDQNVVDKETENVNLNIRKKRINKRIVDMD